jgi:hypothetical protein
MRMILLASMMTMAATAASAESSIDVIKTNDASRSIDFIHCTGCAPLKSKKAALQAVMLKPGTQKIEIKQVNGELKVFRTEAWLGGSPVTYVSKASTDLMDKQSAASATGKDVQPIAENTAVTIVKTFAAEDKPVAVKDKTVVVEEKTAAATTDADQGAKTKVTLKKDVAPIKNADMSGSEPTVSIDNNTTSSTNADVTDNTPSATAPKLVQHFNPQDLQLRLK